MGSVVGLAFGNGNISCPSTLLLMPRRGPIAGVLGWQRASDCFTCGGKAQNSRVRSFSIRSWRSMGLPRQRPRCAAISSETGESRMAAQRQTALAAGASWSFITLHCSPIWTVQRFATVASGNRTDRALGLCRSLAHGPFPSTCCILDEERASSGSDAVAADKEDNSQNGQKVEAQKNCGARLRR
jgi:hypothetical protein